ncbi:MAG: hypothetical protein P4L82_00060 [Ancalomicrobiaceae bacterium]|nr:hypothetical protein [Ancalomicrobiaceae bacterium]
MPVASALAEPPVEQELKALGPLIGDWPPAIKTAEQRSAVTKRYQRLKARLDADVAAHSDDLKPRLQRATLEHMGHNIDLGGSFEAAVGDYKYVIEHHNNDVPAILGLARLYVNANPAYADRAKNLYLAAQCYYGKEPLEEAQRGLFFAYYYKGELPAAKERAIYLTKRWPGNEGYRRLNSAVDAVLARSNGPANIAADPSLDTCKGNR